MHPCCDCAAELARLRELLFVPHPPAVCSPTGFDCARLPDPKRIGEIVAENKLLRTRWSRADSRAWRLRKAFLKVAAIARLRRRAIDWGNEQRDRLAAEVERLSCVECDLKYALDNAHGATGEITAEAVRLRAEVERLRAALTEIRDHALGRYEHAYNAARRALEVPRG